MKYIAPIALAVALSGCMHHGKDDVDTVEVEAEMVEVEEAAKEVAEEIEVTEEAEVVVEPEMAAEEAVTETTETVVIERTDGVTRRVTRRLVDELPTGEATIPALPGSASTDTELSTEARIIEETTIMTGTTTEVVATVPSDAAEATVETATGDAEAADAVEVAVEDAMDAAADVAEAVAEAAEDGVEAAADATE